MRREFQLAISFGSGGYLFFNLSSRRTRGCGEDDDDDDVVVVIVVVVLLVVREIKVLLEDTLKLDEQR